MKAKLRRYVGVCWVRLGYIAIGLGYDGMRWSEVWCSRVG